jgi:hypothetical protein
MTGLGSSFSFVWERFVLKEGEGNVTNNKVLYLIFKSYFDPAAIFLQFWP